MSVWNPLLRILVLCVAFTAPPGAAGEISDTEIEAAYVLKLGKFVTWDGMARERITFCYIEPPLTSGPSVGKAVTQEVRRKGLSKVWNVVAMVNANAIEACNMLYVSQGEEDSLLAIESKLSGRDILSMSDITNAVNRGIMLGFLVDDDGRVRMEANLRTIRETRVRISATVLELMSNVLR